MIRTATVIKRLQQFQPTTAQAVLDACELPLQYIGGGKFRDAYHVIGTELVIKIPRRDTRIRVTMTNIKHARDEYSIWKRIKSSKRKFKPLRAYLPELIYFSDLTGVIVIRRYSKVKYTHAVGELEVKLEGIVTKVMNTSNADVHLGNLGRDSKGSIKLIDMGLFISGKA